MIIKFLNQIEGIFTTREIATGFWIVIILIIILIWKKSRKAFIGVVSVNVNPKMYNF